VRKIIFVIVVAFLAAMATLTLANFTFSTATQPSQSIHQLVVFGDSLSDVGTVYRATQGLYPPNPPYFQGRYSNGRVWVEYLAEQLQLSPNQTSNFAYGGATTGNQTNQPVPGLLSQVETFTQTHAAADPLALYVLWAGANDYLQGTNQVSTPLQNLTKALNTLIGAGAEKILVANLPDLGKLPSTSTSTQAATLNRLTQAHNQGLRRSLKGLSQQHTDLRLVMLDVHQLYQTAIANPAQHDFTNVTTACLAGTRICDHPAQFLFWDGIHPTTAAHRILGEAAFSAMQTAGLIRARPVVLP
jgi:thermolabile hemolysin